MTRQSLLRKYIVVFVALVSGALIVSGLLQTFFAFQESQAALATIQREKAASAAGRIAEFIDEIERLVSGAVSTPSVSGNPTLEQRRNDFVRLLRQAPAIMDVSYLDRTGREQVRISRLDLNVLGSQTDRSQEQAFVSTRQGATYYGPVYFQNASEPFMSLGVPDRGTEGGAVVAEVNLKFVWDVVSRIKVGQAGFAYVVDGTHQLVAHPDISQVLRRADLSSLPQMQFAGAAVAQTGGTAMIARDMAGRQVLTAREPIAQLGWWVFVEQPLEEAFAPLYASLLRTALLLVAGIGLSVAASLVLARRMVTPIQALQAATARFGAGRLDQRIEVNHTGDELEALAADFNHMADQLSESYATLEQRVEARTHDLRLANDRVETANRHKSEFLASVSHELRTPLNAIIGFSEALADRFVGDLSPKQERYVEHILSSGRHLLSLINDLLDLSKVEAGRMDLDVQRFSLVDALESGLTMIREQASRHQIALLADFDPAIGAVEADERKGEASCLQPAQQRRSIYARRRAGGRHRTRG